MRSDDLERIVPDLVRPDEVTGDESLRLHLERYEFAQRHLSPGSVLDIACGSGYGTAMLAQSSGITHSAGVDISKSAVTYATSRYGASSVMFFCSDVYNFTPDGPVDNLVSLETLEHLDDPRTAFRHLVSLVAPRGHFMASAPITPSVDANPYHKTNFSERSFVRLGRKNGLIELDRLYQVQRYNPFAVLKHSEERMQSLRRNLPAFYLSHPHHFALRILSTLRYGFVNRYLTVAWEKPD